MRGAIIVQNFSIKAKIANRGGNERFQKISFSESLYITSNIQSTSSNWHNSSESQGTMKMILCNVCIMTFKILEVKLVWENFLSSGKSYWFKECLSYILKVYNQSQLSSSFFLCGLNNRKLSISFKHHYNCKSTFALLRYISKIMQHLQAVKKKPTIEPSKVCVNE